MHSIFYDYAPKVFNNVFHINRDRNVDYQLRNKDEFVVPHART